jgi:hypothetical protein
MNKLFWPTLLVITLLFAWGVAQGHNHLMRGEILGPAITYSEECVNNSLLITVDSDRNGSADFCYYLWMDHSTLHYQAILPCTCVRGAVVRYLEGDE